MRALLWTLAVLAAVALYASWTAGRLDRLHARVDAAWAALDAQLVRRAAAARALAVHLPPQLAASVDQAATIALDAPLAQRETTENDLTRTLRRVLPHVDPGYDLSELSAVGSRVGLARSVHNSAVTDTRALRLRRLPRALRLGGHRDVPVFFEIDDTALT